jgi:hypothetical protein
MAQLQGPLDVMELGEELRRVALPCGGGNQQDSGAEGKT